MTSGVTIIKGCSGGKDGKWDEVQAIQYKPFIYIQYNGSHFPGGTQDVQDVEALIKMLCTYRLISYFSGRKAYSINPKTGVQTGMGKWVDGPRIYACDGVVRFLGNFERYSHAFCIDTNHKPTIEALITAIRANGRVKEAD